jgi:hypothetical protein
MADTAGIYGSKKGLYRSFPRLTGKAVTPIGDNLYLRIRNKLGTDEEIFLTGLLLCNLWMNDKEHIWPYSHNMNFAGAKTDPIGCIESYLRSKFVDDSRMEDLIESAIKSGYISYDPVPYVGYMSLYNKNDETLKNADLYNSIPTRPTTIRTLPGNFARDDLKYGYLMRTLTGQGDIDGVPGHKWDWDTLMVIAVDNYAMLKGGMLQATGVDVTNINDTCGLIFPLAVEIYEDLDNIVRDMIIKGTIIADDKVVAKVVLTQD